MIKQIVIFITLSLCMVVTASAQTFTQRLQQSSTGGGTVTIHQDKAIDALVNGPYSAAATQPKAAATTQNKTAATASQSQTKNEPASMDDKVGRTYKVMGYRVQVFAGGNSRKDKQQAEQTGSQLRMLFPTEAVYTHFYSPRWICRMGNYRTLEEANQMLQEVKKMGYTAATVVKGKITLQY